MTTTLRIERIKRGWRQTDVTGRTHGIVHQCRLSWIERGEKPRPVEAAALVALFDLPPDELFAPIPTGD